MTLTAYDGTGNPLSYRGMTFTWANGKQLTRSVKSGTATDYTYETGGLRTTKTTEKTSLTSTTHIYIWNEGRLVSDCWGTVSNGLIGKLTKDLGINLLMSPSMLEFMYDESGNPYGFLYKAGGASTYAAYYYVTNLQGDIVAIVDKDGNEVASYTYNAYGEIISQSGAMADVNPLRYRGYYYDSETGLHLTGTRYYDAATSRFINADTTDVLGATPGSLTDKNLFAYCDNNPVMRSDKSGQIWNLVVGVVVGGLIGGAAQAISNIVAGKTWNEGLGTAILSGVVSGCVAASGVGIVASVALNAGISATQNLAEQLFDDEEGVDWGEVAVNGVVGGVAGAVGGPGMGTSVNLSTLNNNLTKKLLSGSAQAFFKGVNYYASQTAKVMYRYLIKQEIKSGVVTCAGSTIIGLSGQRGGGR